MPELTEVHVDPFPPERLRSAIGESAYAAFERGAVEGRRLLHGRTVWNVNSTARGGGVAELLASLLAYARGAGISTRWLVLGGDPAFFSVTKRLHNRLHGADGDGGPLGDAEHAAYAATIARNLDPIAARVAPGDVVILHDPQTAGLVPLVRQLGARVIWRCHVGLDTPNAAARQAWAFLEGDVDQADALVFSRRAFVWEGLDQDRVSIIAPSIDALSAKNRDLGLETVAAILSAAGLVEGGGGGGATPTFARRDGSEGRIEEQARVVGSGALPAAARVVLQVSRWDRLKDPAGVLDAFVGEVAPERDDVHLVLAGPDVEAVGDDPEGAAVLAEVTSRWEGLDDAVARRVHLVCLPMADEEVNAIMVNALQRHATVVVQKSLAEGFGLTVAEAMWKGRPVVASRIGGIQDQIEDGRTGVLLDDTRDLAACGRAVVGLLADPERAAAMGRAAEKRVRDHFLGARHLLEYLALVGRLLPGD